MDTDSLRLYDEFQPWQCACGFNNEGIDAWCQSCSLTREQSVQALQARVEALRAAEAARRQARRPDTPQAPPGQSVASVVAAGAGAHRAFTTILTRDSMPGWRRALESIPGLGPWLNRPSPRWTVLVMTIWAWVFRIFFLLHAVFYLLFGVVQLLLPSVSAGFGAMALGLAERAILLLLCLIQAGLSFLLAEILFHMLHGQAEMIKAVLDGQESFTTRHGAQRFEDLVVSAPYVSARGSNRLLENVIVAMRVLLLLGLVGSIYLIFGAAATLGRVAGVDTGVGFAYLMFMLAVVAWLIIDASLRASLLAAVINRSVLGLVEAAKSA